MCVCVCVCVCVLCGGNILLARNTDDLSKDLYQWRL